MPETVKYTPFGTPIRKVKGVNCNVRTVPQFGLVLDKETGSTHLEPKDPLDLHALIQTFRDQCGMTAAQNLIKRGLAEPKDFAAVPGDYGDTSALPDNLNDSYQASLAAQKAAQASGVDLGLFKSEADIKAYVDKMVSEKLKAAEAAKAAQAATSEVK